MYTKHPSAALNQLFEERPYQGVHPAEAEFVFLGLDANYDAEIESHPVFPYILQYHQDPLYFWQEHRVHHPFLLPTYKGCGRRYHRNFAAIGFEPSDAARVSFLELLDCPTVGTNLLRPRDLTQSHMAFVKHVLCSGRKKRVFASDNVIRLMLASGYFNDLGFTHPGDMLLPVIFQNHVSTLHKHLHFSTYGKFEERRRAEAEAMSMMRGGG